MENEEMENVDEVTDDQRSRELEREYLDYLDDAEDQSINTDNVKQMIEQRKRRLIINMNHLRNKKPERALGLLTNSFEELSCFTKALRQFVISMPGVDPDYAKSNTEFFIGFEGSFGSKHTTPRTLTSKFIGNMVCVEGIVTTCSLVRTKVVRSIHFCPNTKTTTERTYSDLTSFEAFPATSIYPSKDDDGNLLETQFGLSTYKDHQTLTIQEMPEKAPAGQLPRSVDVILDNDLVDQCKPGDRVQMVGTYRVLPGKQGGYTTGSFRTILIANNVTQLNKDVTINVSHDDVNKCKKLSKNNPMKNIFELLSKSLAPSIHGHEYIKKAILCLLLGGNEKILPNGTRLRGDINVLLIGDPSVAKSQLLRYVLSIAPRAITTTGRGSSGVGLTAAVTTDMETRERRLEAGAMVLADRGVICIDEFDKMSDIDRTAIHEVMEQGRVTIAKAGIHASLNARCSVIAAANPVYGRYDQYKSPMENIGLQDSLLSRFDLLFVMLDTIDKDIDSIISEHVVRLHRYRKPNEKEGEVMPFNTGLDMLSTKNCPEEELEEETSIYEKYDPLIHGKTRSKTDQILTAKFMRKYIHIARILKPKLTEEASQTIAEEYSRLRSEDMMERDVAKTQPVTARTLETLIRLSTAHAKARLSKNVTSVDAQAAIELVQYALFKRVLEKDKKRRRRDSGVSVDENDEDSQQDAKRSKRGDDDPFDFAEDEDDSHVDAAVKKASITRPVRTRSQTTQEADEAMDTSPPAVEITKERLQEFSKKMQQMFADHRTDSLAEARVTEKINKDNAEPFTPDEIKSALLKLSDDNKIFVTDGNILLI